MTKLRGSATPPESAPSARRTPRILGVTRDGVKILALSGRAYNFTAREIREAIRIVRSGEERRGQEGTRYF
jgi:hypothetical protein